MKKPREERTQLQPAGPVGRCILRLLDHIRRQWWLFIIGVVCILGALLVGTEYATSRPSFCGSCHIMDTYHATWEESEHGKEGVTCVACHYPPGEHHTLRAKFKGLGQLFSYLGTGTKIVHQATYVNDASCMVAGCHTLDEESETGEWVTKEVRFPMREEEDGTLSTVPYVHKTHFEKGNWIEGQEKHCSICHRHESSKHHMEVTAKTCNLCHFKNMELNEGRAKCSLCHTIPEKPFKDEVTGSEEIVTHSVLEQRGVACSSCHLHHVRGTGSIDRNHCLECHEDDPDIMAKWHDAKSMHEKHVPTQAAHCFSCHETIGHGKPPEGLDHYDAALGDCKACHATPHHNKRLLLAGIGGQGVEKPMPIKHHDVEMGCRACHIVDAVDAKGRGKKVATASVCINCHSQKEGLLIEKWKGDVNEIVEEAVAYEQDALKALAQARGTLPDDTLVRSETLIRDGQQNLTIVKAGGGVHNKKYAALLLDIAIEYFEDAIAELETE